MSPYGDSGGGKRSKTYSASSPQQCSPPSLKTLQNTSTLPGTGSGGGTLMTGVPLTSKPHTIVNMKTTLVNGASYANDDSNCDNTKCGGGGDGEGGLDSDSDLDAERKPLVSTTNELNSISNAGSAKIITTPQNLPPPPSSSFNLMNPFSMNNVSSKSNIDPNIIGGFLGASSPPLPPPPSSPPNYLNVDLVSSQPVVTTTLAAPTPATNWGPDSFSSNLLSSTSSAGVKPIVNSYSEGQKFLSSSYFIKDYSNIFGNIANTYETEDSGGGGGSGGCRVEEVAKLPINNTTLQTDKMFLIGLSSNLDDKDDDYDDKEHRENEDQGSSNSPFHSATEEMGGDGDHDHRGGDQDPLLVRPPPKQNVFHQFIRSATRSTTRGRRMRPGRNGKHHSSFGGGSGGKMEGQGGSSRDILQHCSSSTALIKEVDNPESYLDEDNESPTITGGGSGGDNARLQRGGAGGRRCSIGILLAAISCFFFATSALIVKISNLHPMELLAVRGLIQGILISPIVISTGNSFMGPSGSRSLLLARAVLGAVALVMGFASIHLIQLSDAATVIFTSPVFVSIFACICLGEVCSWFDVAMIALTLVGVLLVSKPSFSFINTGAWTGIVGTICGLMAAMLTALAFIVLRQLKQVHYSVVVFWFSSILAMFGAVLTVALDGFTLPRTWASVMECIGIGFCGFMGQILLTKALQSENALPIAVTRTFDIVLAFFYQITLLHDTPDWYSYLGSVLVVSCVLLTAFRRWYKESVTKKYQRVNNKMADDEPIVVDGSHLHGGHHEESVSPPLTRTSSSGHLHRNKEEDNFS